MKRLNINNINRQLTDLGLNQAYLSKELDVTRETVSKWFKGKYFPLPSKLLTLGKLLKLKYDELVVDEKSFEPVVSFRKVGTKKTRLIDNQRGKEMGHSLEKLVPFLPFETITKPPRLSNPSNDYEYIQNVGKVFREKFKVEGIKIELSSILDYLNELKVIIIPLLLGQKANHENAIHIYLPRSSTTWIYINLDTKIFDFKFWLIHELGHVISPTFSDNSESEKFADNFAGALLFPEKAAIELYSELRLYQSERKKIARILSLAKNYMISPITIYKEVEKYIERNNLAEINLNEFYPYCTNFLSSYDSYSTYLLKTDLPEIGEYLKLVEEKFNTPFFNLLRKYSEENKLSYSFLKSVMNLPAGDTKEMHKYLIHGSNKNNH